MISLKNRWVSTNHEELPKNSKCLSKEDTVIPSPIYWALPSDCTVAEMVLVRSPNIFLSIPYRSFICVSVCTKLCRSKAEAILHWPSAQDKYCDPKEHIISNWKR